MSTFLYNITPNINQKIFYLMMEKRGLTEKATAALYGIYSGKALTITNIPIAMASALASAMIPGISEKFIQKQHKEANQLAAKVMRFSMLIAIPSAAGLIALARPITMIMFPQRGSLDQASLLLAVLAVTVVFYSQSTITNSVLQGTGRLKTPVVNAVIALAAQTALLFALLMKTELDSMTLVITRVFYAFIMFLLNDLACKKMLRLKLNTLNVYIMPMLSSIVMGCIAFGVYYVLVLPFGGMKDVGYFVNLAAAMVAILAGIFVYFALLLGSGAVTESDLRSFPKGTKLTRILRKVGLLRDKKRRI
jgi:stage V sporulation protein B